MLAFKPPPRHILTDPERFAPQVRSALHPSGPAAGGPGAPPPPPPQVPGRAGPAADRQG
ncbi:hypothetical protein GCM10017559_64440 [Streptosporangium longisporum]|uniref:Uncharacterized protein n=1 Tax=Streptosporangium longisporum TaxID=46187 RepID=A0ABP6L0U0_9ACTN